MTPASVAALQNPNATKTPSEGDGIKRKPTNGWPSHARASKKRRLGQQQHGRSRPPSPTPLSHHPPSGPNASNLDKKQRALALQRSLLPIWSYTSHIRLSFQLGRDVLLLVGETGSGKSTQVPQYLLSEPWCRNQIAITQPRRVAAISLARRVADEMGSHLGSSSPHAKVGYSVRFHNNCSPATRIKYLTEGMLMQELLRDPWLTDYSAVIVDEVHERSVNVDLILGFLRKIVTSDKRGRKGVPLKVAVMSATTDVGAIFHFFDSGFDRSLQGQHASRSSDWSMNETANGHKSDSSWDGFTDSDQDPSIESRQAISRHISTCRVEGRQHPVDIFYLSEPCHDYVEESFKTVKKINRAEPIPGDILVFVTGQDTVEAVESLLKKYASDLGPEVPKLLVLPLFAALPRPAQEAIFRPTLTGTRKVIIATNVAETSVTIPGVRYVVDSGLAKVKEYRSQLDLESLLVKPISKSSAIQRSGRAGREASGKCYRLYTEHDYLTFDRNTVPEILKSDLATSVLIMKARGVDDVINFPLLSRPNPGSTKQALVNLYRLGALDEKGFITTAGKQMARLPIPPPMSRAIISAAETRNPGILLDTIDIVAALAGADKPFLPIDTEEKREKAHEARKSLLRREGDHLTCLAAVQAYAAEHADRAMWCKQHYVSHRAMRSIMDARNQLRALCAQQRLLDCSAIKDADREPRFTATPEQATQLLKCFMKGFAANTARLMRDGSYKKCEGNHVVAIHPSSVLWGRKVEAIMYTESVFTQRNYGRSVSAVQLDWYAEALGVLPALS